MLVSQVGRLVPDAMVGMWGWHAHSLLRLRCVVAQGPVSHVLSVLLMMVAMRVGVLFDDGILLFLGNWRLPSSMRSSCRPPSWPLLTAWSMLPYDLPSAWLYDDRGCVHLCCELAGSLHVNWYILSRARLSAAFDSR